jgi:hypothetical protein
MNPQPLNDQEFRERVLQDLAILKEKVDTLEYRLLGNGEKGVMERLDDFDKFKERIIGVLLFLVGAAAYIVWR